VTDRLAVGVLVALLVGCGGADDGGDNTCDMAIAFSPSMPEVGQEINLTGVIDRFGASGIEIYDWQLDLVGTPVPFAALTPDNDQISFIPVQEGSYRVTLNGSVGSEQCIGKIEMVGVAPSGADSESYKLRVVPLGDEVPVQDLTITVRGGLNADLGPLSLSQGQQVVGTVGGAIAPQVSYIRFRSQTTPALLIEAFTNSSGVFDVRLPDATYDVLVVPQDGVSAPYGMSSATPLTLATTLSVAAADGFSGTVLDGAGQPVGGAGVQLTIDGVPTTIATTNGAGQFTVAGRAGNSAGISVVPPAGSGLPTLELDGSAGPSVANGASLSIDYAAALASQSVSTTVVDTDASSPVAAARATWIARPIAASATLSVDAGAPISVAGRMRLAVVTNGAGIAPATLLPNAVYDVVVEPAAGAAGSVTLVTADLTAGAAPTIVLDDAGQVVATVQGDSMPLADVRVVATPIGTLANIASAGATSVSATDGSFTLDLVALGDYEIALDGSGHPHTNRTLGISAPGAGASDNQGAIALGDALSITGQLEIAGGSVAAGAHISVLCIACPAEEALIPVSETIVDLSGSFELRVPDPGVTP
jgi:hypothetical protein